MNPPVTTAWRRPLAALAGFELRRGVLGRRYLAVWILAAMPLVIAVIRAIFINEATRANANLSVTEFAQTFHFFFLRMVVFFACAFLFVKLFRGEILERSVHYALLAPVRRELLVLGKYLGGLATILVIVIPSLWLTYLLFVLPHGSDLMWRHLSQGGGFRHLAWYTLSVVLACVGYGAVFTLAGLIFKNPMVPAVLLLGWEILTPFLPSFLKALSLVHYLSSLTPVPVTQGPFALLAQPVHWLTAILAIVGGAAIVLALCCLRARRMEISYASE